MGVWRPLARGQSAGKAYIWRCISGETLKRNQCRSSALTAMDDCVRGRQESEPIRTAWQFGQLQFHCGKPPPAADPSIRTRILRSLIARNAPGSAGATGNKYYYDVNHQNGNYQ